MPSLVDEIVETFPNHVSIKVNTDMADIIMQAKPLQALGIMVNELITNIMKYAFTGKESGLITVSATYSGGHVVFSIQDNGVGMPEGIDFGNSSGFGLVLIEQLTKQLDGDIRIERGNGTKIVLEFDV